MKKGTQLHVPVLLSEVLEMARETKRPVTRFLDGTFGRGGHTRELLKEFSSAQAVALDRDADALAFGEQNFQDYISAGRLKLVRGNYAEASKLNLGLFDFILLDLGVSSPQLDEGHRGFSFYNDGPLDMRMDQRENLTAAQIVNEWDEETLTEIFKNLGEIQRPNRVVEAIVKDRKVQAFETTRQLASMIERVDGWRQKGQHPATRYFMALRMRVNHELEDVETALEGLVDLLNDQGRLAVITFHSLEDRIVKYKLRDLAGVRRSDDGEDDSENESSSSSVVVKGKLVNKKVIQPTWNEQKTNPRARSAKLRGFERNTGAALDAGPVIK